MRWRERRAEQRRGGTGLMWVRLAVTVGVKVQNHLIEFDCFCR